MVVELEVDLRMYDDKKHIMNILLTHFNPDALGFEERNLRIDYSHVVFLHYCGTIASNGYEEGDSHSIDINYYYQFDGYIAYGGGGANRDYHNGSTNLPFVLDFP